MHILITHKCLLWLLLVKRNYKYFIGYKDDDYENKPLHITLPKTSGYVKSDDGETKWVSFFNKGYGLLKKCNGI